MGTDTGRRREPREEVQAPTVRQNQFNERLANLRLQLLITAAQVTPWDDFAASASAWAAEAFRRHDPAPSATAQQMLQARLTEAQNRFTLLESLVDSTKRLYQVLTPEQQRVADYYLPTVIP